MKIFEAYDIERIAEDITIVKYSEKETQVYANLTVEMVELEDRMNIDFGDPEGLKPIGDVVKYVDSL